jgi:hypothetical protein
MLSNGRPFRRGAALNVAFYEAAMVGLAYSIRSGNDLTVNKLQSGYNSLESNPDFLSAISQSTANQASLKSRIELAIEAFK